MRMKKLIVFGILSLYASASIAMKKYQFSTAENLKNHLKRHNLDFVVQHTNLADQLDQKELTLKEVNDIVFASLNKAIENNGSSEALFLQCQLLRQAKPTILRTIFLGNPPALKELALQGLLPQE